MPSPTQNLSVKEFVPFPFSRIFRPWLPHYAGSFTQSLTLVFRSDTMIVRRNVQITQWTRVSRRVHMEVRKLTVADAEAFWNIRLRALRDNPESFGASYEEILERGIAGITQGLRKRDTAPDDVTFGAFEGNTLVGIAGFRREEEAKRRHKGVIWGMYVPQELRGKGIGKALLQAAIAYAKTLP